MIPISRNKSLGQEAAAFLTSESRAVVTVTFYALALLLFLFEPKVGIALLIAGLVLSLGFTRPLVPVLGVFGFLWVNDVIADFLPTTQVTAWKDVFILFVLVTWLFRCAFQRRHLVLNSLIAVPLIVVMLHFGVMTVMSPSAVHAILGMKTTVFYMAWFFAMPDIVKTKADARNLVFALLFGTVCLSIYNLWRAQQPLGTFPVRRDGKFLSGGLQSHFSGAVYLLPPGLLVAYAFFLGARGRQRLFMLAVVGLVTAALIATNGRAAWLTSLGAIIVMSIISRRQTDLVVFLLLGVVLGITGAVRTTAREGAVERAASAFDQQDVSRNEREAETTDLTVPFILRHPLGVGTGSMTAVGSSQTWGGQDMNFVLNGGIIHNTFFLVAIEIGWSGMIFYAIMLVAALRASFRVYRDTKDAFLKQLALGLVGVTVAFAVMHFFALMISAPLISVIIWPLLGLIPVVKLLDDEEAARALTEAPAEPSVAAAI